MDQPALYVREVSSFGEIRIRDRAEAEEHLLRDEYLIGGATEVRRQGLFAAQVRQKLMEVITTVPPPDENNRPSVQFHKGIGQVAQNLDWLKGYQTEQVQVFDEWHLTETTRNYEEAPHVFDEFRQRSAKVYLNLPRLAGVRGGDTVTRGTCIGTHQNVEVTEDGKVGAYISLVVVLELNKWQISL